VLRSLEQTHRSTIDDHVHRTAAMGTWVLINAPWYKYVRNKLLNKENAATKDKGSDHSRKICAHSYWSCSQI
jgi:hypothetical protein